jgi:hypothetical protein
MLYPLPTRRSVSVNQPVSLRLRMQRRSSLLLVSAVALFSACGEPNPVDPASAPTTAELGVTSNSIVAKACQKSGWQSL